MYLAVVLDLFSRRVIGWAMPPCIDRHLVFSALDMALKGHGPPVVPTQTSATASGVRPGLVRQCVNASERGTDAEATSFLTQGQPAWQLNAFEEADAAETRRVELERLNPGSRFAVVPL